MKVNIDVPQELSDITLIQYQRFLKLQEESEDEVFLGQKMIEIFCNVSENIVKSLKVNDAYAIVDILTKMLEKKTELRRVIKIKGVKYGFIPNLDEITFGEYVDLDTHLGKWDEMHKAMAVLYRPIENEKNGKYNIKDYDAKFNEDLLYIPMDAVMGSIVFFFSFREGLVESYDELFNGETRESISAIHQFSIRWGWFTSIYGLSQGDIRRIEDITKLNVHLCLNFLLFEKQKNILEASKIKNRQNEQNRD